MIQQWSQQNGTSFEHFTRMTLRVTMASFLMASSGNGKKTCLSTRPFCKFKLYFLPGLLLDVVGCEGSVMSWQAPKCRTKTPSNYTNLLVSLNDMSVRRCRFWASNPAFSTTEGYPCCRVAGHAMARPFLQGSAPCVILHAQGSPPKVLHTSHFEVVRACPFSMVTVAAAHLAPPPPPRLPPPSLFSSSYIYADIQRGVSWRVYALDSSASSGLGEASGARVQTTQPPAHKHSAANHRSLSLGFTLPCHAGPGLQTCCMPEPGEP